MLTQRQRETFRERGLILLSGLLPREKITAARDVVLRVLERRGVWRQGSWQLDELQPSTSVIAGKDLVKGIKGSRAFADLVTSDLYDAVVELADGRAVVPMTPTPQLLFTLPNAEHWSVPHKNWHLDMPRLPEGGMPGVQLFTFLDAVSRGGGGTLVVAGSHRLLNTGEHIRSKDVKRRLSREPYFRDLMSRDATDRARFISEPDRVGDVELQVVELHGRPGDVYLVDLRMLHTLARNASRAPRIMLTQRYLLEEHGDPIGATGRAPAPDEAG